MLVLQCLVFLFEFRGQDISYAESVSACLVHIGRSYAFEGGTNLGLAFCGFACGVKNPVGREYEVCSFGDEQLP